MTEKSYKDCPYYRGKVTIDMEETYGYCDLEDIMCWAENGNPCSILEEEG